MRFGRRAASHATWSAVAMLVLASAVSGCSDKRSDDRSDPDASTTSVESLSTTSALPSTTTGTASTLSETAASDAVLSAYLAFWNMYIEVGGAPPPFDAASVRPRLDALTTGAETAQLFDFLQKNAATGVVLRGDMGHSASVLSNDGTVAVVRDCLDDRTGVFRVADNSRVDSDDPARHLFTVGLRQVDGAWKVETVSTEPNPCTS